MHIKVLHVTKVGPMCTQESSQLNILGQRLTHRFVTISARSAGSVSSTVPWSWDFSQHLFPNNPNINWLIPIHLYLYIAPRCDNRLRRHYLSE